jgi:hypothetical protein
MADEKDDELCGGFGYRKKYNRILFWLIIFSTLACIQSFLIMTKIMSGRSQNYYISTTGGQVKLVQSVE